MEIISFGPHLVKTNIDEKDFETIKELAKETSSSMHNQLAGKIEFQRKFDETVGNKIFNFFKPKFAEFLNSWQHKNRRPDLNYNFYLENLWINRMKKGEYNPEHNHSGDISFVYYLDVPEQIHQEQNSGMSVPHGAIYFTYGKDVGGYPMNHFLDPIFDYVHIPKQNELLIFPSYLYHTVQQFDSDVERVSIAGNAFLEIKESV